MLSLLVAAGWPIWPLLAVSIIGLALIIERLLSLRRSLIAPTGLFDQVIGMVQAKQDTPQAITQLERHSALGYVLATMLRDRDLPRPDRRESAEQAGRAMAHRLNRYLPALSTIATIAPLMGLFGTVVGMIDIFGAYDPSGGNPAQLAHGISVALYNTGLGILIAIPALIFHRWLRSRSDAYLNEMEQTAARLERVLDRDGARTGTVH